MKIAQLLAFGLLSIPFMAYADNSATVKFGLIDSIPYTNPVNITAGYIEYYYRPNDTVNGNMPKYCPSYDRPIHVDLNSIINLPLPVSSGTASRFTFTLPSKFSNCLKNGSGEMNLVITQVDGISKPDGVCHVFTEMYPNETSYRNISIHETTDSFYCGYVDE